MAPAGQEFRPSALRRVRNRQAGVRLIVSDAGLAEVDGDGDVHFSPWAEIAAVVPHDRGEGFAVVTRDRCLLTVDPELHGRAACAAIREHLPEHLWVRRPAPAAGISRTAVPIG